MITKIYNPDGTVRFVGIAGEAERLGVTRSHLWKVLKGDRKSKILMSRIRIREVK